jgi:hypothetical protein
MRWSPRVVAAVGLVVLVVTGGCGGGDDDSERVNSARYHYSIALDPAMTPPVLATETWDGRSGIEHASPVVDEYDLDNSDFFFVVGAPVDGTVREFATEMHQQAVQLHGCDLSPEITETELDGAAALRFDMLCSGTHIQRVYAVKDGRGLLVALGADATRKDENRSTFDRLVSTVRWES